MNFKILILCKQTLAGLQFLCVHVNTFELCDLASPEGHCGAWWCACGRTDLKHVCVGVMRVLHNDRVAPGQRVGDAVLAFVAECLPMERH